MFLMLDGIVLRWDVIDGGRMKESSTDVVQRQKMLRVFQAALCNVYSVVYWSTENSRWCCSCWLAGVSTQQSLHINTGTHHSKLTTLSDGSIKVLCVCHGFISLQIVIEETRREEKGRKTGCVVDEVIWCEWDAVYISVSRYHKELILVTGQLKLDGVVL